jgi:hypothetical protein
LVTKSIFFITEGRLIIFPLEGFAVLILDAGAGLFVGNVPAGIALEATCALDVVFHFFISFFCLGGSPSGPSVAFAFGAHRASLSLL